MMYYDYFRCPSGHEHRMEFPVDKKKTENMRTIPIRVVCEFCDCETDPQDLLIMLWKGEVAGKHFAICCTECYNYTYCETCQGPVKAELTGKVDVEITEPIQ